MGDFLSDLAGGETDEQRKLREQQERNIAAGYGQGAYRIGGQYFGPQKYNLERIQQLDDIISGRFGGVSLSPAEIEQLKAERDTLINEVESSSAYTPDQYDPVMGYKVEGYTPTSMTATTESSLLGPKEQYVGDFAPAAMQGPSEAAKATADPYGLSNQRAAIEALANIYKQGGLTDIDRARLEDIRQRNQMMDRANREAIMSEYAKRGQSGSGRELLSQLVSGQGASDRMSSEGLGVAADAEQRKLEAMLGAGNLGRQLAQDVYTRQFETGNAQDIINAFNTLGTREVQAAERDSLQKYIDNLLGIINRDADRITNASEINTQRQTDADQAISNAMTNENQWGASTYNVAQAGNVNNANQAKIDAINQGRGNIAGWNVGQQGIGGLAVQQVSPQNQLVASTPTPDYVGLFGKGLGVASTIGGLL